MERKLLTASVILCMSGVCLGAGILPEGPASGSVKGTVRFNSSLAPPANPFVSVIWNFKGNNVITSSGTEIVGDGYVNRIALDRNTGSLELKNLALTDSGEYKVTIIPYGGLEQQGTITLTVYEVIAGATLTRDPVDLIENKTSSTLSCGAAGSIAARQWMKDGRLLSPGGRITFSTDNSQVTINPVLGADSGEYLCRVSNPVSSGVAVYQLVVNFGPHKASIDGPATASPGQRVELRCFASSVPPATFSWMFNGSLTTVRYASYVIERMEEAYAGNYTCKASNSVTKLQASTDVILRGSCAVPCWSFAVNVLNALLLLGIYRV